MNHFVNQLPEEKTNEKITSSASRLELIQADATLAASNSCQLGQPVAFEASDFGYQELGEICFNLKSIKQLQQLLDCFIEVGFALIEANEEISTQEDGR